MQKVVLLPRMPGYKLCCFTTRLVTINLTFAPIGSSRKHNQKPLAILWNEAIAGRKDEDVSSAYVKALSPNFRDYTRWVVWLDNCSGQNKCWTLYTTLIRVLNTENVNLEIITLKYFTAGHTLMSADNVHRGVEREMKKMDKVYDFADFEKCVRNVADVLTMDPSDFSAWDNGLSNCKTSKNTRPLLSKVNTVEFRKGSSSMFFKLHDEDNEKYYETDFLQKRVKNCLSVKHS